MVVLARWRRQGTCAYLMRPACPFVYFVLNDQSQRANLLISHHNFNDTARSNTITRRSDIHHGARTTKDATLQWVSFVRKEARRDRQSLNAPAKPDQEEKDGDQPAPEASSD